MLAITSESLDEIFGAGGSNETDATNGDEGAPNDVAPTDQIVQKFIFDEPAEPIVCEPYKGPGPTESLTGSGTNVDTSMGATMTSLRSSLAILACAAALFL